MADGRIMEYLGLGLGLAKTRRFRRWLAMRRLLAWTCYEFTVAGMRRRQWVAGQTAARLGSFSLSPWLGRSAKVVGIEVPSVFGSRERRDYLCLRLSGAGERELLVDGSWVPAGPWLAVRFDEAVAS